MSTAALTKLLDLLTSILTPSNMQWLGEHLIEQANPKPYNIEELHARIEQSERDSAEGKVFDFDDVMREIENEFAYEETLEMAEAV